MNTPTTYAVKVLYGNVAFLADSLGDWGSEVERNDTHWVGTDRRAAERLANVVRRNAASQAVSVGVEITEA